MNEKYFHFFQWPLFQSLFHVQIYIIINIMYYIFINIIQFFFQILKWADTSIEILAILRHYVKLDSKTTEATQRIHRMEENKTIFNIIAQNWLKLFKVVICPLKKRQRSGWLIGQVLWHINPCRLFAAKSSLYIY